MFRCLIQFEFICVYDARECSNFIHLHVSFLPLPQAAATPPHCVAKQEVSMWLLILFLNKQDKVDSD